MHSIEPFVCFDLTRNCQYTLAGLEVHDRTLRLLQLTADVTVVPAGVALRVQRGVTHSLACIDIHTEIVLSSKNSKQTFLCSCAAFQINLGKMLNQYAIISG